MLLGSLSQLGLSIVLEISIFLQVMPFPVLISFINRNFLFQGCSFKFQIFLVQFRAVPSRLAFNLRNFKFILASTMQQDRVVFVLIVDSKLMLNYFVRKNLFLFANQKYVFIRRLLTLYIFYVQFQTFNLMYPLDGRATFKDHLTNQLFLIFIVLNVLHTYCKLPIIILKYLRSFALKILIFTQKVLVIKYHLIFTSGLHQQLVGL